MKELGTQMYITLEGGKIYLIASKIRVFLSTFRNIIIIVKLES